MSIEFPDLVKPSDKQFARVLDVIPSGRAFDEDDNQFSLSQLARTGKGFFRQTGELNALVSARRIETSNQWDNREFSALISLVLESPAESLCVRVDAYETGSISVYLYPLEDLHSVERALAYEIASRQIRELANQLGEYREDVSAILREAIVASPVGAQFLSEETARMIQFAISVTPEKLESSERPRIQKQGI